jgi:hypothetical protein
MGRGSAMKWRSISKAPKDGRSIPGLVPNHEPMPVWWEHGRWDAEGHPDGVEPTHWKPIYASPGRPDE